MAQCCHIQSSILNCLYFCLVSILDLTTLLPYFVKTLVCMNTTIHIFEKKNCVCVCVYVCMCSVVSDSLGSHGLQPAMLLCPWDFPSKKYNVVGFLLFPTPWNLPDPGIEPKSPMSPALAGIVFTTCATWEARLHCSSWVAVCRNTSRAESWFPTDFCSPGNKPSGWLGFLSCLLLVAPGVWGLTRPRLCPSYPSECGLSLFLSCRKSVFLCVVVVLVCLWKVNSESSYSTISILNQN